MRILVTGATGSLGSAVMRRLKSQGHEVIGIGRSKSSLDKLKAQGFVVRHCDLLDRSTLKSCMKGQETVIHCAAYATPFGRKKLFFETNVTGLQNLFDAAMTVKKCRMIVISSASVFDGNERQTPHADDTPPPHMRPKHPYGASKYDAERLALTMPAHTWIGLRPRAVFGPGDQTLIPRLNRLIGKNSYTVIGDGETRIDVTCLSNFLDAVECAIEAPLESMGRFYNISNADPRRICDILKAYGEIHGATLQRRSIPHFPVAALAFASVALASMIPGKPWEPKLTPYGLRQLTQTLHLDISGAKKALGWAPLLSFEQGLEALK